MKKLFLCVATALCSTFAFADGADLVVKPVTISNGSGTMEVVVNKTGTTAFQFDVKLPTGVSATAFSLTGAPESRQFENAQVDASTNTWRFLTYDNGNAAFDAGTTFNVTLAATAAATTNEAETENVLLVDPNGNGTDVAGDNVVVTVKNGVEISIGQYRRSTLVSEKDLNFSDVAGLNAYIVTGYNKDENSIMMTRVKDVPAGTPILVVGDQGKYEVPETTSSSYYPENFLKGSATGAYTVDYSGTYLNMKIAKGEFVSMDDATVPAGKCYLQLPANITSQFGADLTFTMGTYGKKGYIGKYDLDFTGLDANGLKAYVLTGCNAGLSIFMTRVKKASAGTALLLIGTPGVEYTIPSTSSIHTSYINMLKGNANETTAITRITDDDWANWTLQKGQFAPYNKASGEVPAGNCYLPIPMSIVPVPALSRGNVIVQNLEEAEIITMKLGSIFGGDETTGIRSIDEGQFTNDVWYNLNGQRIDTPTKKGLYIKNGKKVLVK